MRRFGRDGQVKLIGVRDVSVHRDIYTLRTSDGQADVTIETDLLASVDGLFPPVIDLLSSGGMPNYWQWRHLSRFMAFQLARTLRIFQVFRDEGSRLGIEIGPNDPQLAMLHQPPFLDKWICRMKWILGRNQSSFSPADLRQPRCNVGR